MISILLRQMFVQCNHCRKAMFTCMSAVSMVIIYEVLFGLQDRYLLKC